MNTDEDPKTCAQCEADIHDETDEHWENNNIFCSDDCLRQWNIEADISRAEQLCEDDIE